MKNILSIIGACISIGFLLFCIVRPILQLFRNERGYQEMEADRKAKGLPYLGQDDEELEKEMYDIWD